MAVNGTTLGDAIAAALASSQLQKALTPDQLSTFKTFWETVMTAMPLPNMTDWVAYTPTIGSGFTGANVTATGLWRRVGGNVECQVHLAFTGAPTGSLTTITIPAGLTIDTTKLLSTAANHQSLGMGTMVCGAVGDYLLNAAYASTTAIRPVSYTNTGYGGSGAGANTGVGDVGISAAVPGTFTSGDSLDIKFSVPIVGWSAVSAS